MSFLKTLGRKLSIFGQIWAFLRVRKRWWLLPIVILFIFLGILIFMAQTPVIAPFVYTLF